MGLYDLTLKTLLEQAPEGLVHRSLGPDVEILESVSTDLRLHERRADHLRRVRRGGAEALLLVEVKAEAEADMGKQLFGYFAQVKQLHGFAAVFPLIVVLRAGGSSTGEEPLVFEALGRPVGRFDFDVLRVHEMEAAEVLASAEPGLLPLVSFMRGANVSTVAQAGRTLRESSLARPLRADLQAVLVLLSASRFGLDQVQGLIPKEIHMESPLYESILKEGRQEGLRQAVLQSLEHKLEASVRDAVRHKLEALGEEQLLTLLLQLGDAGSRPAARQVVQNLLGLEP